MISSANLLLIDPYRLIGWVLLFCWLSISGMLSLNGHNPWGTLKDAFRERGLAAIGLCSLFLGVWLVTRGEVYV